jgi:2-polyprenyl-3-methyl-5-hydroxy-6-metoxy-1,4-benzoquinol methylase
MHDPGVQYNNCPICGSSIKHWRTKKTDFGNYRIDQCFSCHYAFINPRPTMGFLVDFYSNSGHGNRRENPTLASVTQQERLLPNSSIDATRIIMAICSLLYNTGNDDNRTFLDIGCGYGFFSRAALLNKFDVVALELASTERQIAEQMAHVKPIPSSFEHFTYGSRSFSAILMSHSLEHALDVNLWISKAHALLKDGGVLAIAIPNFMGIFRIIMQENEPYICPPAHLNFFGHQALALLLKSHGFRVQKVEWVSRIPPTVFGKRFSNYGYPALCLFNILSTISCSTIDALHLGMIINVYATKTS